MKRPILSAAVLLLASALLAGTNTPYPEGTRVSITTRAGTVTGTLQEIDVSEWISIREDGAEHPTFVRGADVIVRRAPELPTPERMRLAPDAIPSPPPVRLPAAEAIVGHYVMGQPRPTDDRFKFTPPGAGEEVEGVTVLVREAFTVGHYDKRRVPAWVAMSWTTDDFHRSEAVSFGRGSFVVDTDLPVYARGGTSFEFSRTQMERGHMARDADLEAWGFDAVREGMRMSNIVPQRKGRNHVVWGRLENQHRNIVADPDSGISTVWIVSGPIFYSDQEIDTVGPEGGETHVPHATYKVIAWEGDEGELHMRGYVIDQDDTNVNLTAYLRSIDEVEELTGLDFFWELDDSVEDVLEQATHVTLWE